MSVSELTQPLDGICGTIAGRIVVALGGNALLRRGEPADAELQRRNVEVAAEALARLASGRELVVTHGNGPQIGLLALQGEALDSPRPYPLDVLGAESEGMIGYLLEQALDNVVHDRRVATLLTQVVVDPADQAFARPTKPIGPVYERAEARRLAAERGWPIARDGRWYRRVVPSPAPMAIVELSTIQLLLEAGVLVVCAGGGGIPVVHDGNGAIHGVEAVIDKDRSAALLAVQLRAESLLLLTDVEAVMESRGTSRERRIPRISATELLELDLPAGSMGPKAEAAAWFVRHTGGRAAIGRLGDAGAVLAGDAGTMVVPG
jgi:carbamate kinase